MIVRIRWRRSIHSPRELVRRCAQGFFFAAGFLALGLCGLAYLESALYQVSEGSRLDRALRSAPPEEAAEHLRLAISNGSPFGRIEIPRIGVSVVVVEGITPRTLKLAAGHIPGTAFPGEPGNAGIAAHRDTFFRNLRKIKTGDTIVVTALYGSFRYSVDSARIVKTTDVGALDDSSAPSLTLVTCYPFYYVGPAPKRFIVRARQIPGPFSDTRTNQ
jgi:sortase A